MLPRISLVLLALAAIVAVSVAQYGKKAKEPKTPKDPCPSLKKQLNRLNAGILKQEKKIKDKVTTPLEAKKAELTKQDAKMAAGGCSATGEATEECAPIVKEREGVAKAVSKLEAVSKRMDKKLGDKKAKVEKVNADLKKMGCIKGVNGGWGNWTAGACSATCGSGVMTSTRTCDSPAPADGGAQCEGDATKKAACQVRSAKDAACAPAYDSTFKNVALRKSAAQSSTYGGGGNANRAVDGNRDGNWRGNSCTHTASRTGVQWWRVDLGADYWVGAIIITNRLDCCSDRLKNAHIYVHASPSLESVRGGADQCVAVPSVGRGQTKQFQCDRTRLGRYVTIYMNNNFLTLCEVQVLGKKA